VVGDSIFLMSGGREFQSLGAEMRKASPHRCADADSETAIRRILRLREKIADLS